MRVWLSLVVVEFKEEAASMQSSNHTLVKLHNNNDCSILEWSPPSLSAGHASGSLYSPNLATALELWCLSLEWSRPTYPPTTSVPLLGQRDGLCTAVR